MVRALYRDDGVEPLRETVGELQRYVAAERGSHEDGVNQFQCIYEGDDEVGVVVSCELVFLGPPLGVFRRV